MERMEQERVDEERVEGEEEEDPYRDGKTAWRDLPEWEGNGERK